ncbi:MAG: hypothetical protein R2854_13730 [Caldilineaceae bacterium]
MVTEHEAKSISQERTFSRDVSDGVELRRMVQKLAAGVAKHLQRDELAGSTVKLKLRWADFTTPAPAYPGSAHIYAAAAATR